MSSNPSAVIATTELTALRPHSVLRGGYPWKKARWFAPLLRHFSRWRRLSPCRAIRGQRTSTAVSAGQAHFLFFSWSSPTVENIAITRIDRSLSAIAITHCDRPPHSGEQTKVDHRVVQNVAAVGRSVRLRSATASDSRSMWTIPG